MAHRPAWSTGEARARLWLFGCSVYRDSPGRVSPLMGLSGVPDKPILVSPRLLFHNLSVYGGIVRLYQFGDGIIAG